MNNAAVWAGIRSSEGAQIAELAVSLPLLVVLFVGIYDFGQAFNFKEKLVNAVREGARFSANQTMADMTNTDPSCPSAPRSICAVRDVVDQYLTGNNLNDCGLSTAPPAPQAGQWKWTFTVTAKNSGCAADLTLTVDKGVTFTYVTAGGATAVGEATQVSISYPYQWQFSRMVKFLAPTASFAGPSQIPATSAVQNLN